MAAGTLVDAVKAEFAKHGKDDASRAMVGALTWTDLSEEFALVFKDQSMNGLYMPTRPLDEVARLRLTMIQQYIIHILDLPVTPPLCVRNLADICEFADGIVVEGVSLIMSEWTNLRFDGKTSDIAKIIIVRHDLPDRRERYGGMCVVSNADKLFVTLYGFASPIRHWPMGRKAIEKYWSIERVVGTLVYLFATTCLTCGNDTAACAWFQTQISYS
jgi:hypothetical protein